MTALVAEASGSILHGLQCRQDPRYNGPCHRRDRRHLSSTLLTLLVLPALYRLFGREAFR